MRTEITTPPEWRAALAGYLAWLSAVKRPASTQKLRSYHLRRFAATTGLSPRRVTHDDLITYLGSNDWSASTTHSVRSTFRNFYLWAHRVAGIVDENPTELLPPTRPDAGVPRPAAETAIEQAMSEASERVRFMIDLASTMGLRCCEIAKVHTGDVFEHPEDGWCLRVTGKGRKKRNVPLSPQVRFRLRSVEPGYAFPGDDSGHLSPAYVSKLISRALPAGVTAHMLRHRFASKAYVGASRDIRAVQELLGHASVSTTQIYTYVPSGAKLAGIAAAAA